MNLSDAREIYFLSPLSSVFSLVIEENTSCQGWHPNMVSERSPGAALSQQGLKAGHEVGDNGFKLEKGTKATAMHTQELRAQ